MGSYSLLGYTAHPSLRRGTPFAKPIASAPPKRTAVTSPSGASLRGQNEQFDHLVYIVKVLRLCALFTRKAVWQAFLKAGKKADVALDALMERKAAKEKESEESEIMEVIQRATRKKQRAEPYPAG